MKWAAVGLLTLMVVSSVSAEDELNEGEGPGSGFFREFGSESLAFYAPVSEYVGNEVCRAHSRRFLQGLREKELWALKMLDASSKLPDSILQGNLAQLGNYDECLSVENVAHPLGVFSGRHCTVSVGSGFFSNLLYMEKMANLPQIRNLSGRLEALSHDVPAIIREFGATVSVCIPSSCSHRDLERHLRNEMRSVLKDVPISVGEFTCSSRADVVHFTLADWMGILVISSLISLIVAGTYHENVSCKSGSAASLLEAFSLSSNIRGLLKTRPPSDDQLASLDVLRVLSAIMIFCIHFFMLAVLMPSDNLVNRTEIPYSWIGLIIATALAIDTFFLLSGLLIAYNYFKDRENNKEFSLLNFYKHRFIRLTPSYAAVVLMTSTIVVHMGDGPLWKPNIQLQREGCQEEGIYSLLYIHNYFPVVNSVMEIKCANEGWYLSLNMQLYWLSPLVLYPLWRCSRLGKLHLLMMIILGLAIAFAVPYIHQYRISTVPNSTYFTTHTRLTPWLMGIGLGYLLYSTRGRTYSWLSSGILLGQLIMVASIYPATLFVRSDYVYDRLTSSLYACLMRPTWTLGVALMIVSCARGPNRSINAYFSAPIVQILSRLSYAFYLIQFTVLRQLYLTKRHSQNNTDLSLILEGTGVLIITFAAAFVLYVTVEAPFATLLSKKCSSKSDGKSQ